MIIMINKIEGHRWLMIVILSAWSNYLVTT